MQHKCTELRKDPALSSKHTVHTQCPEKNVNCTLSDKIANNGDNNNDDNLKSKPSSEKKVFTINHMQINSLKSIMLSM